VLLDLRIPKRDGTEVLRAMRAAGDRTPVICVTARAEERDRVLGLDLGADDYVTKPFSVAELMARVRACCAARRRARATCSISVQCASSSTTARRSSRDAAST